MPFELFVALRYLSASRRRAHVALISAISVGGLALGVAALIVSLALLTGFQDRIRERLTRSAPHLILLPSRGALFDDPGPVLKAVSADREVVAIALALEGRGWITDSQARTALPVRYRAASAGGPPEGAVDLASAIAGQLGIGVGSFVDVYSSRTILSPLGPVPVSRRLRVRQMRRSGVIDNAAEVEISFPDGRALAGSGIGASRLEVRLRSPEEADAVAQRLARSLRGDALVKTWKELNSGLTFALRMEKILIFVTVFLIVLVASLNVVSDLSLLVVEKRRDLGVLATLGAAPASLSRITWWLAGIIGVAGTALGAVFGAGCSWVLDRYAIVPLPSDVYLISHVPFALHPRDLALTVVFSLATALAAAILPARSAARVGPAEAVRLSR